MLSAYYDRNEKDNFEKLFKGTYIYDHPTKEKNSYYILRFDFSGLNTDDVATLKTDFYERVKSSCQKFIERYHVEVSLHKTDSAASYLSNFLNSVSTRIENSIYVIVDE